MHPTNATCQRCGGGYSYLRYAKPRIYCSENCRRAARRDSVKRWTGANRDKINAAERAWRRANPEREREAGRRAREKNPEYKKAYYRENKDRVLAVNKRWAQANRELVREIGRRWRQANPELYAAAQEAWRRAGGAASQSRKRRARQAAVLHIPFTETQLRLRLLMYPGCWMCGGPKESVDHVKPLAKGGAHVLANLRPACVSCNSAKRDRWPFAPPRRQVR